MRSSRFAAFAAALAACALLACGFASASEVTLSAPEDLTDQTIPGQQTNPSSVLYNGLLYVFWASNSAETPIGQDYDITYSTYDGSVWSQNIILTSNDTGNDHTPRPAVFRGTLYLFWSSDDPGLVGGNDAEIVFSAFEGGSWTAPESITSGIASGGDYNPCPIVFLDCMDVFFEWFSPQSVHYEIGHVRFSSGSWAAPISITENSTGHNLNPTAAVVGSSLLLAWETASDALAGTAERAIASRILNGGQWSGYTTVSGEAGPMNMDPYLIAYGGGAILFWSTNSEALSQGGDFDIVARAYGAGGWDAVVTEIAAIQDTGDDVGPSAVMHEDVLFLTWISSSYELDGETEADTDVLLSLLDDGEWSKPVSISYNDGNRNDGGGATHRTVSMSSYDGEIFMVWETNASPLLTVTVSTWLVSAECDLSAGGTPYYWYIIPFAAIAALVAFMLLRKRRSQR